MTGNDIREQFLQFFESKGHRRVAGSSLVPANDPTLLFANAGMNQFKQVFLGEEARGYSRAVTAQKCVRAGGKHNDLENVGRTRRHHTFFEMMGNFSFGDYFKEDAIRFAWELVTGVYGLPKERLFVTVFEDDDEAEELWRKAAGIGPGRIFRCGAKDNFWQMGDTGPCGPCSEIFYDLGPQGLEPGEPDEPFPADVSRYVEIWNLVFMQFDRGADGNLSPLPKPSIDTGMGLERMAAVLQGTLSNFETDLIRPLVDYAGELLGLRYGDGSGTDTMLRIVADHSRAAAFLVHDDVAPSNEGRGYVLRKIIRRALRHARLAGSEDPFLHKMTGFAADLMAPGYPELRESADRVARVISDEEARYRRSFAAAEREFETVIGGLGAETIPGTAAFKLYDTYGLSLDEQEEMARERGLTLDRAGFETEMERQRRRARASWKGAAAESVAPAYRKLLDRGATEFLGYEHTRVEGLAVVGLLVEGEAAKSVEPGVEAEIVLDRTPFYAESGGQAGDRGALLREGGAAARIVDAQAPLKGLSVHRGETLAAIRLGDTLCGEVDAVRRDAIRRNHTATHLMHAALRKVLGVHVKQAGSVVDADRLRFDVTHFAAIDPVEIAEVERLVNREILVNTAVATAVEDLDEAVRGGAMALFGEKYADKVRVVSIGGFSKELCGGTHVSRTGDIGVFKLLAESGVSAGVRRIEAVTGTGALQRFRDSSKTLARAAAMLRVGEPDLVAALERLLAESREREKQIERLKTKLAQSGADALAARAREIDGMKVVAAKLDGVDRGQLRSLADAVRSKIGSGLVVLGAADNGKVALIAAATKDVAGRRIHAGKVAGAVAALVGGGGGGRPDMAEAGGRNPGALAAAIEKVYEIAAAP